MQSYILIEPIQFGELQEKQANAITWTVSPLVRGSTSAYVQCYLLWVDDNGGTFQVQGFTIEIDNNILQSWGSDDTVIDDIVLAYSPLFIKRT